MSLGVLWDALRLLGASARESSKAGFIGDGEACHGDAIVEACGRSEGLERLRANGGEEDGIEIEERLGGARDGEMTAMGRVETSSEKRHAGTIEPLNRAWVHGNAMG